MNAGDELRLRVSRAARPAGGLDARLRADRRRLGKGRRLQHRRSRKTVLPLPSHDAAGLRRRRAPAELEDDPVYRRHPDDWQRYHTRYVTPRPFLRRAEAPDRSTSMRLAVDAAARVRGRSLVVVLRGRWCSVLNRQTVRSRVGAGRRAGAVALRLPARGSRRARRASTSSTRPRPSTRGSTHIMPQVASMGAAVSVADFDRDGWQDLYVTNSGEGSLNRLYRNRGDGTFEDVAGGAGRRRRQPRRDRRVDGRGLGRLRQRRLRGPVPLQVRPPGAVPQRRRTRLQPRHRARRAARWVNANSAIWLDYDRDGLLDLFIAGYWAETLDLWHLDDDADHAGELRVRRERRAEVPAPQPRRRHVRGRHRRARASRAAAGRWPSAAADCSAPAIPTCSSPTTTACRSSTPTRGASGSSRSAATPGVGRTPKSGMNASFGDVFNDGRLAIYMTNISEPGVLVQGNNLWVPQADGRGGVGRRTRTWRRAWASSSAAGAGARSSAT